MDLKQEIRLILSSINEKSSAPDAVVLRFLKCLTSARKISKLDDELITDDKISASEITLRNDVALLLAEDLKLLASSTHEQAEIKQYIQVCYWVIRLGRTIISREKPEANQDD
jgi:hypothetical protein